MLQSLVNGAINGLVLALLALGFSLVYVPTRVFHLALASIYAAAPFVVWSCLQRGIPAWLAVPHSLSLAGLASVLCEIGNHSRLQRLKASPEAHLISSLGLYIVMVQGLVMRWGNDTHTWRSGASGVIQLGPLVATRAQLVSGIVSVAVLGAVYGWLGHTSMGLRFRAMSENPTEFALRGYNVRTTRCLAFGLSGTLAAAAAILAGNDIGFDAASGLPALLLAVVGVIVGGRLSFAGAALGAAMVGLVRAEAIWVLSARWEEAATFLLLALFMQLRLNGLRSRGDRLEAS